jgi:hypothetical protein
MPIRSNAGAAEGMLMSLSILFVPFDAAIQHYSRNALKGVKGFVMEKDILGNKRKRTEDEDVESPGSAYEFRPVKKRRADPTLSAVNLKAHLENIIGHTYEQIVTNASMISQHPYLGSQADIQLTQAKFEQSMARREVASYPDVVFLSEQPGELIFPVQITLKSSSGLPAEYILIGNTGTKAVQRIYGYVRKSIGGNWAFQSVVKQTAPFNAEENVLVVQYKLHGKTCCFAGVHLSSKNVGANSIQRQEIMSSLVSFCKSYSPPIQFVLGDFNIDVHGDGFDGNVGARPGSTVYLAQQGPATMGVRYQEQYSNSTNTAHFMGHVVVDPHVSLCGLIGLSLQRSLAGEYFSDHPPIYVELEFGYW